MTPNRQAGLGRSRVRSTAVIPSFNCGPTLQEVVERSLPWVDTVMVVDDGSTDDTSSILATLEKTLPRLHYVSSPRNLGKSEAVRRGVRAALEIRPRIDAVVQLDADLAHDPQEIPKLLRDLGRGVDVVIGDRHTQRTLDAHRRALLRIANGLLRRVVGVEVPDPACGFRAYSRRFAGFFLAASRSSGYGLEVEQLLLAQRINAFVQSRRLGLATLGSIGTRPNEILDALNAILCHWTPATSRRALRNRVEEAAERVQARRSFSAVLGRTWISFHYSPQSGTYFLAEESWRAPVLVHARSQGHPKGKARYRIANSFIGARLC